MNLSIFMIISIVLSIAIYKLSQSQTPIQIMLLGFELTFIGGFISIWVHMNTVNAKDAPVVIGIGYLFFFTGLLLNMLGFIKKIK
ncbi:hypothetical protein OXPF_19530 [Oxobacter pfennigii]|uniref:Uncharacterized protein n=1 Tax=Oxobacter pfennigii TaxID=36849 RepID=A0A0P8YBM0_9CLOT|nr:hypothetical protein [Oxobacter pfennigii]KPU44459.1 hypothetical protein OXPF_19530 [Oxobacter pfennigii]